MNKTYYYFNLKRLLFLLLLLVNAISFGQISPSGQSRIETPSILSGCARDTIWIDLTNLEGPSCTSTGGPAQVATYQITLPGNGQVEYQANSVGSEPAGSATFISYASQVLTIEIKAPGFGATTRAFFVVNASCDVTGLNPLPQFEVSVTYPASFPTAAESWSSAKMNTGLAQITITENVTNEIAGFDAAIYNTGPTIVNTGFGRIDQLTYHMIVHDSLDNYIGANKTVPHLFIYGPTSSSGPGVGVPYSSVSRSFSTFPDYQKTPLGNGSYYVSVTLKGNDLDVADGYFDPGDKLTLVSSYFRAPETCQSDLFLKRWVTYNCAAGGSACQVPDTINKVIKISAGKPIISALNSSVQAWDGCPNKTASFTYRNTGTPVAGKPEVSTAYDVDLSISLGGNLYIDNLTFSGVTTVPTVQTFPGAASLISWKIKNQLTFDPDGAGGLSDLDGDGFFDDLLPGDSCRVTFTYTVDCDLACGANLNYQITARSTFTDYCRKLNGTGSTLIYRFGFSQTNPIVQTAPIPNLGALTSGSVTPVTGNFTLNYRQYNLNTASSVAKLRINYSKTNQVTFPVTFLGASLDSTDFTLIGTGHFWTPGSGVSASSDKDSAMEYTLTAAQIALLLNNTMDNISYSMEHIACDSFQNQSNSDNWQILFQINTNNCPPVPCALDLACKMPFAFNYSEGCGYFPCYRQTDSIYRQNPTGYTAEDEVTGVTPTPAGTAKFYEGDTLVHLETAILSSDWPIMEPIGQTPGDPLTGGFYSYFTWTYDKPADLDIYTLSEPYLEFLENISRVKLYDTTGGTPVLLYDLPLKRNYFYNPVGGFNGLNNNGGVFSLQDNIVNNPTYAPANSNSIPGNGLGDFYCYTNQWVIDQGSCPYLDHRYRRVGAISYNTMMNEAKTRVSEQYYLYWERAFIDAGITLDPGYTKYKWVIETKWRINPNYPHTNVKQLNYKGRVSRRGNAIGRPYESRTLLNGCSNLLNAATAITKELVVQGGGADYSAACGLTIHNKLFFKSVAGDYFPSEVRVPFKLDSIVVDLPAEYHTTSTTPTTLTGSNGGAAGSIAVTGTSSAGGYTGHLVFTNNTGVSGTTYADFPRISDADGLQTAWDVAYPLSNVTTDNFITESYRVPVKYYTRDEFGNITILIDTFSITESQPAITIEPLGGAIQVDDGGGCTSSYMDILVSNNTIYGASNVFIAAESSANSTIVSIADAPGETPADPLEAADISTYGTNNYYGELGGMAAGGRRIIRITFNSTECFDSLKIISNFGCNYPASNKPEYPSTTIDSAYITFNNVTPALMSGPINGNKKIINLCADQTIELELRNVKNPNISNILAGFKLPANVSYVTGTAQIAYPTNTYVAAPSITLIGTDSININVSADLDLTHACGLPGSDETMFPTVNYQQSNTSAPSNVKIKFDVSFTACPSSPSNELFYHIEGENYCGTKATTEGVFNFIYVGDNSNPTTYSCRPMPGSSIAVCAKKNEKVRILDDLYVKNTGSFTSTTADTIEITIAMDTNRMILSNFAVA